MNIIFIAPPAAGKGTYSKLLKEKYGFNHISAGEALREEVAKQSVIGSMVKETMEHGDMIDDEIMAKVIENKINSIDLTKPFILDGYPRKLNQVKDYERILESHGLTVDKAIFINIDKETGLKRKLGRAVCPKCGKSYNTLTGYMAPKKEGLCDDCNISLETRKDDTKEAYENIYEVYMSDTLPTIEYFKNKGKLYEVDGSRSPEETFKDIELLLGVKNG